jgi:hypothetical protein
MQQIIQGTEQVWLGLEIIAVDGTPVTGVLRDDADLILAVGLQNNTTTAAFVPAADAFVERGYGAYLVRRSGEFATLGTVTLLGTYDGVAIIGQAVQVVAAPATEAKQDAAQDELLRTWRAADPISRGQARWTISGGQAADVTLSEPV